MSSSSDKDKREIDKYNDESNNSNSSSSSSSSSSNSSSSSDSGSTDEQYSSKVPLEASPRGTEAEGGIWVICRSVHQYLTVHPFS